MGKASHFLYLFDRPFIKIQLFGVFFINSFSTQLCELLLLIEVTCLCNKLLGQYHWFRSWSKLSLRLLGALWMKIFTLLSSIALSFFENHFFVEGWLYFVDTLRRLICKLRTRTLPRLNMRLVSSLEMSSRFLLQA